MGHNHRTHSLEQKTNILRSIAIAAPGDAAAADRTKCSYFVQTDYDITTEYNIIYATMTTTEYVPIETVFTTSSTDTRVRTHKKSDTVVLASTCTS